MRKAILFVIGILLFTSEMTYDASANGIIRLRKSKGFGAAIKKGRIQGVNPNGMDARNLSNISALNKAYPGQAAQFRNTLVNTNAAPINGLVSKTGSAADQNTRIIGAWNYRYPTDPDLTSIAIDFQLFFPQIDTGGGSGIDTMSLTAIDSADQVKLWRWGATALTTGSETFDLHFRDGAGAGGSTSFFEDPSFDLASVVYLQFNYEGALGSSYPPTPDGDIALWTGAQQTVTRFTPPAVPEPGPLVVCAFGTLGLAVWRLRRSSPWRAAVVQLRRNTARRRIRRV